MASRIAQNFLRAGDPAIATYNYTDVADGTGFVIFYALEGTDEVLLRDTPVYSNLIVQYVHCTTTNFQTVLLDIDYDTVFNTPRTLKGKSIINITLGMRNLSVEATNMYVICKIRKWDGTTETEIANNQSDTFVQGTASTDTYSKTMCVEVETPETLFKAGETLRLTIELWGRSPSANAFMGYGQDPTDRNDVAGEPNTYQIIEDAHTTKLEFHAPFKLNL